MPAYHYVALSSAGKELSGIIEAVDDTSARANLNQLGLSVVSLKTVEAVAAETTAVPQTAEKGKTVFEFEAIDRKGRHVVGTIVGEIPVKVFARLFDEYQLNVTSLVPAAATPQEKEQARAAGVSELRAEYEKLFVGKKRGKEEGAEEAQAAARKELLEKVDFTMREMEKFLKDYYQDLKEEQRESIQSYLNQLVRIKESTNLEHIRATCEKMLDYIQKQELFLHEEDRLKESAKLKVETKELLGALKRTGLQSEVDIVKSASRWQENPLLRPLANFILRLFAAQNPEIRKLREEIKSANHHLRSYWKMLILGKSKTLKLEAWESIKTIREEKKRLKLKLQALKMEERKQYEASRPESFFWDQVGAIIGWVLAFYLATYIIAYPLSIKLFNLPPLPKSLYFYQARITTVITIALFLAYAAVGIRNYWLRKHGGLTLLLYPLTVFGFLLIVINLM